MDINAWELVEEGPRTDDDEDGNGRDEGASSEGSRAKGSIMSNSVVSGIDAELSGAGEDIVGESLRKDGEKELAKSRKKHRSKSPALEPLRKVSRLVAEKVNKLARGWRDDVDEDVVQWALSPAAELEYVPLDEQCERPVDVTQHPADPTNLRKILSPLLLGRKRRGIGRHEKCAYLFQSTEDPPYYMDAITGTNAPERVHVYDPYCGPVHGSRRLRARRKRLIDVHNLMSSVEAADNEELSPILQSQAYIAKVLRKRRRAFLTGEEKLRVDQEKHKILVSLGTISLAFLFLFTGFHGLQNLQTSVNAELGADCLCILYVSLAVSSLFIPSFIVGRMGCKMTLIMAIGIHIVYMLANFVPRYSFLAVASALTGVAASCLWAAKCTYITESGVRYAKLNIEAQNVVIVRFFGYFFMIVHLGQVLGNLLSSFILSTSIPYVAPEDKVDRTCGHSFAWSNLSALSEQARINLQRPPQYALLSVVGVDLACVVGALLVVLLLLDALQSESQSTTAARFTADVFWLTMKNLRRPKPVLLIPLTLFNGVEQAFAVGVYTKAYTACGLGIGQIGFVMTSFGVADAICSLVFGPLIKLFGRMPLFVFGAVVNLLMLITLMIWPLNPGDRVLFNVIAGVWGMADGVWNTQLTGLWVALLGRDSLEVAFANYRFWANLGLALGFLMMRLASIDTYLLTSFVFLLLGVTSYFMIELYDMFTSYVKTTLAKERRRNMDRVPVIPTEVDIIVTDDDDGSKSELVEVASRP